MKDENWKVIVGIKPVKSEVSELTVPADTTTVLHIPTKLAVTVIGRGDYFTQKAKAIIQEKIKTTES